MSVINEHNLKYYPQVVQALPLPVDATFVTAFEVRKHGVVVQTLINQYKPVNGYREFVIWPLNKDLPQEPGFAYSFQIAIRDDDGRHTHFIFEKQKQSQYTNPV